MSTLYYPSAGQDTEAPLLHFHEVITDFYFVDLNRCQLLLPADFVPGEQHTVDLTPSGVSWRSTDHQTQVFTPTGKEITVHQVAGKGWTTLLNLNRQVDVFFYRGDSTGGGGSNTWWLSTTLFPKMLKLDHMQDLSLLVTDGSNGSSKKRWRSLCMPYMQTSLDPQEALLAARPFRYLGREFHPESFIPEPCFFPKGPTLVWKVTWESADNQTSDQVVLEAASSLNSGPPDA